MLQQYRLSSLSCVVWIERRSRNVVLFKRDLKRPLSWLRTMFAWFGLGRRLATLYFLLGGILKRPFRLAPHYLGVFVWFGPIGDFAIIHFPLGAIQKSLLGWLPTRYYLRLSMVDSTLLVANDSDGHSRIFSYELRTSTTEKQAHTQNRTPNPLWSNNRRSSQIRPGLLINDVLVGSSDAILYPKLG